MITFNEFINKYLGKKIDYDGYYGGQCVDLYRQYVKEVLDFPQSPKVNGAADIWNTVDRQYYEPIKYTIGFYPSPGDIVIWNRNAPGGFGHVAICVQVTLNGFTSFDQNWPTLSKCTLTDHTYENVTGWLHPKNKQVGNTMSYHDMKQRTVDLENELIRVKDELQKCQILVQELRTKMIECLKVNSHRE